jgi:hypothetical protein
MDLALPLFLSGSGVAVAALAYYNREKPAWQQDMKPIMLIAVMQVALGAMAWIVLRR